MSRLREKPKQGEREMYDKGEINFKIPSVNVAKFYVDFWMGVYPHQRLGQAFVNVFMPIDGLNETERDIFNLIFYSTNDAAVNRMILLFCRDICKECGGEDGNHFLNCSEYWEGNNV